LKFPIEIAVCSVLLAAGCATPSTSAAHLGASPATAGCDAQTSCQSDEVAARDRAEYQRRADEERDRDTLVMTLMISRPH
jgi:hypothetical protein